MRQGGSWHLLRRGARAGRWPYRGWEELDAYACRIRHGPECGQADGRHSRRDSFAVARRRQGDRADEARRADRKAREPQSGRDPDCPGHQLGLQSGGPGCARPSARTAGLRSASDAHCQRRRRGRPPAPRVAAHLRRPLCDGRSLQRALIIGINRELGSIFNKPLWCDWSFVGLLGLFDAPAYADASTDTEPRPPAIRLFIRNLRDASDDDPGVFCDEVRVTYLHELGHLLGLDEDALDARGLA
ncbi:MAG: hypothetical protein FJ222_02090 [Lentisphaerae bacterium]|nr:hypothetical protein [Lentisphaerota bacterium]